MIFAHSDNQFVSEYEKENCLLLVMSSEEEVATY